MNDPLLTCETTILNEDEFRAGRRGCSYCIRESLSIINTTGVQKKIGRAVPNGGNVANYTATEAHSFTGYFQTIEITSTYQVQTYNPDISNWEDDGECESVTTYTWAGDKAKEFQSEVIRISNTVDQCPASAPLDTRKFFLRSELDASDEILESDVISFAVTQANNDTWTELNTGSVSTLVGSGYEGTVSGAEALKLRFRVGFIANIPELETLTCVDDFDLVARYNLFTVSNGTQSDSPEATVTATRVDGTESWFEGGLTASDITNGTGFWRELAFVQDSFQNFNRDQIDYDVSKICCSG